MSDEEGRLYQARREVALQRLYRERRFGMQGRVGGDEARRRWVDAVTSIEVELHPGGRAVLRDPGAVYRVEMYFTAGKTKAELRSLHVEPDETWSDSLEGIRTFDPDRYWAALELRLLSDVPDAFSRVPRRRPRAGQALESSFYERVLDVYNALVRDGHPSPAKELAKRMDAEPATVRSWLRRGRLYMSKAKTTERAKGKQ